MNKTLYAFVVTMSILVCPPTFADSITWFGYMESGGVFNIVLDHTAGKFDDSVYTGNHLTDPLGTIAGGATYTCVYNQGFVCEGYNQGTGSIGTWTYTSGDIRSNLISLWGKLFVFDGNGDVYDEDWGLVGHLEMVTE